MCTFLSVKKILQYDCYCFRGGPRLPLYPQYKQILRRFDLLPCSEFGDATQLANKIEKLVDDPKHYEFCATNVLKNTTQYDWENIFDALDKLYTS